MTVVVYQEYDGLLYLAADRQACVNSSSQVTKKLHKIDNDTICAYTGAEDAGLLMVQWLRNGEDLAQWPEVQKSNDTYARLIVARKGVGCYYYETQPVEHRVYSAYAAWGSGRDPALGALYMRATPYEAVQAAIYHNIDCGYGVDCYNVEA